MSISKIINELSEFTLNAASGATLGYVVGKLAPLGGLTMSVLSPQTGVVCAGVGALAGSLFWNQKSNSASKIIGVALTIFMPFLICQRLDLPITFGVSLAVSLSSLLIQRLASKFIEYNTRDRIA